MRKERNRLGKFGTWRILKLFIASIFGEINNRWKLFTTILFLVFFLVYIALISSWTQPTIPFFLLSLNIILGITMGIIRYFDILFSKKDWENFAALPIKTSKFYYAKIFFIIIQMLCVNYFISLSPFVVYIVYLIKNNYAIEFIIFQFGSLFFLPFFSALIAFSTIISLSILLNLLFYKTYRREGYSALLSFAFVIAITFGFVYLFRSSNKDFANIIIMAIGQIVTRIDVFAIFIAFAFCVFLLIVLILEKFYPTLLLMFINSKTKNITYKYKNKRHSQIGCIFRNECSKLIESPAYFFNSVFTIIILIIIACGAAIYSAIAPNTFINIADSFKINIDDIHTYILFLIPFIIAWTITTPSSCTISFEKKTIWQLQSSPITKSRIIIAKYMIHIFFVAMPVLFASIILSGVYIILLKEFDWLYFSMIAILPTAITLTNGLIAITINFYIYTFKWTSETSLAKNSCSVIIYAVYVWILVGILSLLIYLLINQIFVVVICVYCYILLAIIMCIILLAKNKIHFF